MYFSFRGTTLRFVSGFYTFIRCHTDRNCCLTLRNSSQCNMHSLILRYTPRYSSGPKSGSVRWFWSGTETRVEVTLLLKGHKIWKNSLINLTENQLWVLIFFFVKWQHVVPKVSLTFWFFDVDILLTSWIINPPPRCCLQMNGK